MDLEGFKLRVSTEQVGKTSTGQVGKGSTEQVGKDSTGQGGKISTGQVDKVTTEQVSKAQRQLALSKVTIRRRLHYNRVSSLTHITASERSNFFQFNAK